MTQTSFRVRLTDVELEVSIQGPPDGPAVFLLHGFPQGSEMWARLAPTLAEAGYLTYAVNQRGYGASGKPQSVEAYDLDRLAEDISDLAGCLGLRSYDVIGHDWGAAVGWWLAGKTDRGMTGLVAISAPHPSVWRRTMAEDAEQRRMSRYIRFFRWPAMPELLLRLTSFAGFERATREAGATPDALASYRRSWRSRGNPKAMLNWYRALVRRPYIATEQITIPVLFIHGEHDPFLSRAAVEQTAAIGPFVETARIDGGDHWLIDRAPDAVGRLALAFLKRR